MVFCGNRARLAVSSSCVPLERTDASFPGVAAPRPSRAAESVAPCLGAARDHQPVHRHADELDPGADRQAAGHGRPLDLLPDHPARGGPRARRPHPAGLGRGRGARPGDGLRDGYRCGRDPSQAERRRHARGAGRADDAPRRPDLRRRLAPDVRRPADTDHEDDGWWCRLHIRISATRRARDGARTAYLRLSGCVVDRQHRRPPLRRGPDVDPAPDGLAVRRDRGDAGLPVPAQLRPAGLPGRHRDGAVDPGRRALAEDRRERPVASDGRSQGGLSRCGLRDAAAGVVRDTVPSHRSVRAASGRPSGSACLDPRRWDRRSRGGDVPDHRHALHHPKRLRLGAGRAPGPDTARDPTWARADRRVVLRHHRQRGARFLFVRGTPARPRSPHRVAGLDSAAWVRP